MKKLAFALLLLQPIALFAASGKPNAADFPITIHVVYSRSISSGGNSCQQIEGVVDGKQIELTADDLLPKSRGVLALGDYPARISPTYRAQSFHPNTYDIYQGYDLLMPDGKIRSFQLTAVGLSDAPPPASPASTNP
jgi:hypothetical protein